MKGLDYHIHTRDQRKRHVRRISSKRGLRVRRCSDFIYNNDSGLRRTCGWPEQSCIAIGEIDR